MSHTVTIQDLTKAGQEAITTDFILTFIYIDKASIKLSNRKLAGDGATSMKHVANSEWILSAYVVTSE